MKQIPHNPTKTLLRLLVEITDGDSRGEDGVVWVFGREVGGGFGGEVLFATGGRK